MKYLILGIFSTLIFITANVKLVNAERLPVLQRTVDAQSMQIASLSGKVAMLNTSLQNLNSSISGLSGAITVLRLVSSNLAD
jgi:hypothetical protein